MEKHVSSILKYRCHCCHVLHGLDSVDGIICRHKKFFHGSLPVVLVVSLNNMAEYILIINPDSRNCNPVYDQNPMAGGFSGMGQQFCLT
jgi:hypothetical protein